MGISLTPRGLGQGTVLRPTKSQRLQTELKWEIELGGLGHRAPQGGRMGSRETLCLHFTQLYGNWSSAVAAGRRWRWQQIGGG